MAMTETAMPSQFVPVSQSRHGGRYWRRFTSYDFARGLRQVPIVSGEHEQIAANFPILFRPSGPEGAQWCAPMALLRAASVGNSAFVAANGSWRAHYVPSILRVHPFGARPGRQPEGGPGDEIQMALLVDEASGLISDNPDDEPFFDADGEMGKGLTEVVEFFRQRTIAARKTQLASVALARAGVMKQVDPDQPGMADLTGFQVIDRARFQALSDTVISQLFRSGALALAIAHFVSLSHVAFLHNVEKHIENLPPEGTSAGVFKDERSERLSDFLDALAEAQDFDLGEH